MKKESRRPLFPIILALFFLLACDQKSKNPVSEYGDVLIDSYKRGQQAGEIANLDAIQKTIQAYHAINGEYPKSLKDIESLMAKPVDTDKYDYDPQTGTIKLKSN